MPYPQSTLAANIFNKPLRSHTPDTKTHPSIEWSDTLQTQMVKSRPGIQAKGNPPKQKSSWPHRFCALRKATWPILYSGHAPNARRGKQEIPKKTRRPAASSSPIPTCENHGVIPPGFEPGPPWWEANPPTSSIIQPNSYMRKSWSDSARIRTRSAVVGGECSSCCGTAARALSTHHVYLYLLYLEPQDDGPDKTQYQARVPIHYVFCTNALQSNLEKKGDSPLMNFLKITKIFGEYHKPFVEKIQTKPPLPF
ncbi:hypothetical protein PR048_004213 [Dryococelus australis]|uniref:Uncharacterized protein n=1 Tax=Dryococelus australis TaxID=614101 RepID=A0ABQ9I609_9NEOP|nr:hypothetical protein PR048_004213 [Dryococelus australis]